MPRRKEEPFLDEALCWVEPGTGGASGMANNPLGTTVDGFRRKLPGECELHGHDIVPKSEYSITHGSVQRWGCKHCRTRWKALSVKPVTVTEGFFRKRTRTEMRVQFTGQYEYSGA